MTEEERILLNELKASTEKLFRAFQNLEAEKKRLEGELVLQKEKMNQLRKENDDLNRENEKLELANRILSGDDENNEAGKKLNKIIREIDKCIALLNR